MRENNGLWSRGDTKNEHLYKEGIFLFKFKSKRDGLSVDKDMECIYHTIEL